MRHCPDDNRSHRRRALPHRGRPAGHRGAGRDATTAPAWLLPVLGAVSLACSHAFAGMAPVRWRRPALFRSVVARRPRDGGPDHAAWSAPGRHMPGFLGVMVFPLAALMLLSATTRTATRRHRPLDWRLQLYAWFALLAYATLAVAALLALMLFVAGTRAAAARIHRWLRALPPFVELETLLFRTIARRFHAAHRDPAHRGAVRRGPACPASGPQDRR